MNVIAAPATIAPSPQTGGAPVHRGAWMRERGMGATVLNRARIGKGSLVGANALVAEGKEFPDYSLIIGAPARAVRTLREEEVARLRMSAGHYVANWRRFVSELTPIEG